MLAYILAIAVGLASLSLYLSAFFLPELHRKDDFLWSGVGLFYALVLWVCAGRITGGVLLGQSAAVTLVVCFGWQTLRLRRAIAHPDEKTDIRGFSLVSSIQNRFQKKSSSPIPPVADTPQEEQPIVQEATEVSAETETEMTPEETPVTSEVELEQETEVSAETETETTPDETLVISEVEPEQETEVPAETDIEMTPEETSVTSEVEPEDASEQETASTIQSKQQGFSLKSLFGLGKSKSEPTTQPPENLTPEADLEESNWDDEDEQEVTATLDKQTEAMESEAVAETSKVNPEESIEKETPEMTDSLEEYVAEFEPYMADDDAETVIEEYQPNTELSESKVTQTNEEQPLDIEDSTSQVADESNQEIEKKDEEKLNQSSE